MNKKKKKIVNKKKSINSVKKNIIEKNKKKEEKSKEKINDSVHKTRIKIIGIGGGAENIISEIYSNVKNVDFLITDTKSFNKKFSKIKKVYFGESITHGFGTGMNPEIGELSAESEKKKIESILLNQDVCIFVSCLGGGAGSGAMPIFAKIARSMNIITYGVFTLPFNFEGEKKKEYALSSIEKSKQYLNSYSIIPNEKIFEIIDKQTPIKQALSAINKKLAENLEGFIEMIHSPGLINIDFADFKTILSGKGRLTFLNTAELSREKIDEDLNKVISDPFFSYNAYGSKGIIYNITGGDDLQIKEVSLISKTISSIVSKRAKIIFGINQNKKNKDKIKTTILAVGCGEKDEKEEEKNIKNKKPKKKKKEVRVDNKEKRKNGIEIKAEQIEKEKEFFEEDSLETPTILRNLNKF